MKVHMIGVTEIARESILKRIGEIRFNSLRTRAFEIHPWTIEELETLKIKLLLIEHQQLTLNRQVFYANR
jgi:hypothetical protein